MTPLKQKYTIHMQIYKSASDHSMWHHKLNKLLHFHTETENQNDIRYNTKWSNDV